MSMNAGDPIPAFRLPTDGGGTFDSTSLQGKKAVLYFYPKDDTTGCTKEALAFRDLIDQFSAENTVVIGISKDSVSRHDKFKGKHELTFPLLSDEDGHVCEDFGVWVEKSMYGKRYMGIERATFLVAADGTVARVWRKVKVPGHAAEVLDASRSL